ncbi:hypothetical protein AWRI1631_151270 [Saccharomyces cerevisiae AWRI1631]|uniref:Uncharacterized protein n=1 Tax=Saccharomyces cerevisiae (strain AWRI1631) TaxID=545124 RepID=B5VRM0_YEAS6|nr:hypothetical protein AWRI1631_151270 [Saccharomyces cerevisiae AWRI1631]
MSAFKILLINSRTFICNCLSLLFLSYTFCKTTVEYIGRSSDVTGNSFKMDKYLFIRILEDLWLESFKFDRAAMILLLKFGKLSLMNSTTGGLFLKQLVMTLVLSSLNVNGKFSLRLRLAKRANSWVIIL